jgi:hypothetical protein
MKIERVKALDVTKGPGFGLELDWAMVEKSRLGR